METQSEQPKQPINRLAIVSLVLGIIASAIIPTEFLVDKLAFVLPDSMRVVLLYFPALLGLLSLIIGDIAFRRASAKKERGRGIAIAGFILGILAIFENFVLYALIGSQ